MKRLLLILALIIGVVSTGYAQNAKKLEKAQSKMYKVKMKEYKKEGWKLDSQSKTLEVALLEHYDKLAEKDKDGNQLYYEIVGNVNDCKSTNVCRRVANNNALVDYAERASGYVKGRVTSETSFAGTEDDTKELDSYYSAFERIVGAEIKKGVMRESYSIIRYNPSTGKNEYKMFFLVSEDKAALARIRAHEQAMQESKLSQERGKQISTFVNEPFNPEQ